MKHALMPLAFAFCILIPAGAQDGVTGTRQARDVGFAPWTFNLNADGTALTGTVSQGGSDPATGIGTSLTGATPIRDGAIEGNRIAFTCTSPGGGDRTITFAGVVEGDSISFSRTVQVRPGGIPG
jgi:hypothetical protein